MQIRTKHILLLGIIFSSNVMASHGSTATVKGHLISWDNNKAVISVEAPAPLKKSEVNTPPVHLTVARKYLPSVTKFVEGEYVMAMIPLNEDLTLQPMPEGH